jgi:hypothetical protein
MNRIILLKINRTRNGDRTTQLGDFLSLARFGKMRLRLLLMSHCSMAATASAWD